MGENKEIDLVKIRLAKDRSLYSEARITTPEAAVEVLQKELEEWDRECLAVVNLQTDGRPINICIGSIGTINASLARPADLLKASILCNAANIILVHNHPSGNPAPSRLDILLTKRFQECCSLLGFELLDHVIVGSGGRLLSMRTEKLMDDKAECSAFEAAELERYLSSVLESEEKPVFKTQDK